MILIQRVVVDMKPFDEVAEARLFGKANDGLFGV
jgi:hypothetical protein